MRMNSCWKPVGISLRNKSPIGMLLSAAVARILSHSSSTVRWVTPVKTPCEATCDEPKISCDRCDSVSSVPVLRDRLPSIFVPCGCFIRGRVGDLGTTICGEVYSAFDSRGAISIRASKNVPVQRHPSPALARLVPVGPGPPHAIHSFL